MILAMMYHDYTGVTFSSRALLKAESISATPSHTYNLHTRNVKGETHET